jgi:hypothetical protein
MEHPSGKDEMVVKKCPACQGLPRVEKCRLCDGQGLIPTDGMCVCGRPLLIETEGVLWCGRRAECMKEQVNVPAPESVAAVEKKRSTMFGGGYWQRGSYMQQMIDGGEWN